MEANTKRKFRQFAHEYGLVVIGYSGRDRSVMDTLELLLKDEDNYRQGVYWCVRSGTSRADLSSRLKSFLVRDRVHLVEVDGFDEFVADLHQAAELPLPRPIASPFEMARDRSRLFLEDSRAAFRSHPVIRSHIRHVIQNINSHILTPPLPIEAARLSSLGDYSAAIPMWQEAYEDDSDTPGLAYFYADTLARAEKFDDLRSLVLSSPLEIENKLYFLLRGDHNELVVEVANQALESSNTSTPIDQEGMDIVLINRAIAFERLERFEEMRDDLDTLEKRGSTERMSVRAGVAALRGDRDAMLEALRSAVGEKISREDLKVFPVFEDFQEDPDFVALTADPDGEGAA